MFFCCSNKKEKRSSQSNINPNKIINSEKLTQTQALPKKQNFLLQMGGGPEDNNSTNLTNVLSSKDDQNLSYDSTKANHPAVTIDPKEIEEMVLQFRRKPNMDSESDFVSKLISSNLPKVYVLHQQWALNYTYYLKKNGKFPGPITNKFLCKPDHTLLPNRTEGQDYVLLNQQVWDFLYSLYGGGPELKQLSMSILTPLNESMTTVNKLNETGQPNFKTMSQRELPIVGLANPRFYCYLNSVVQCLMSIPQLNAWIIENREEVKKKKGVRAYLELIISILNSKNKNSYFNAQGMFSNKMSQYEMQDCQEYLLALLTQYQLELKGSNARETLPPVETYQQAFQLYLQRNNTIIDHLFVGQQTYTIKCKHCDVPSQSHEPFFDLSLALDKSYIKSETTLSDCLKLHFKDEIIESVWECEKCKKKSSKIRRSCQITYAPNILIFHFKRFRYSPVQQKIKDSVAFPLEIDIAQFLSIISIRFCSPDIISPAYILQSVIVHQGQLNSGHYVAFVRRGSNWFLVDDESCQSVSKSEVMRQQAAYILFYEKK